MEAFSYGQRVRVVEKNHPLFGRSGIVVRLRHADSGAWVKMDKVLPKALRQFPDGDKRARNILLYPEQCEPVDDD